MQINLSSVIVLASSVDGLPVQINVQRRDFSSTQSTFQSVHNLFISPQIFSVLTVSKKDLVVNHYLWEASFSEINQLGQNSDHSKI